MEIRVIRVVVIDSHEFEIVRMKPTNVTLRCLYFPHYFPQDIIFLKISS